MKKLALLLILILNSCKSDSTCSTYGFLIEETIYLNNITRKQINEKLTEAPKAQVYDSLTNAYLNYLEKTYSSLISNISNKHLSDYNGELSKNNHTNKFFFDGENYSEKGTEFIHKLDEYRIGILKIVTNENLREKIEAALTTLPVRNQSGEEIDHLNYFYRDMPLISVLTFLKFKEKCVLDYEYEFMQNLD